MADKGYKTTTQAAEILSVSPDTVLKWAKAGKLKAHRTLGGHFRIPEEELQALAMKRVPRTEKGKGQPTATHHYCWEFHQENGEIMPQCKECITYRSRSKRCYELRQLTVDLGSLQTFCQSTCEECDFFLQVKDQPRNVLILYKDEPVLKDTELISACEDLTIEMAHHEYECSALIERFRPDFVVVDCAFGPERTNTLCDYLSEDNRIPMIRIILCSRAKKIQNYCEKNLFGWIRKPFTVQQLKECTAEFQHLLDQSLAGLNGSAVLD